jgi:hypothetical protein
MSLNREVTEPMEKANRENSQKSTGPKTQQGKLNSSRNAFRHGLFARKMCPWTEELDESEPDYQRFYQRYQNAYQARDEVEALLVADMARTQWRLERLLRAESACLALQRGKLVNEQRRQLAGEGIGVEVGFEKLIAQEAGYGALHESEGKYELILLLLGAVGSEAESEGYTERGTQCLQAGLRPAAPGWPRRTSCCWTTKP